MNIHAINVIARYEVKLLKRSWLFRIFAVLALFILTIAQLSSFTPLFWKYAETWNYVGATSLIPFFTVYLYNIAQSVIVIFLAGNFLKRDKKLDTAEVIYVRPMSNADYIIGKVWGITRVFIGLNLMTLCIALFINLVISRSPFSIFPYLFYLFTLSIPSLWFVLGLSFTIMCLVKNQAVTFIVMLGITGTVFFYLQDRLYGVFDFFGVTLPAIFSDVVGHPSLSLFLLQRSVYLLGAIGFICLTITLVKRLPHRPWKTLVINIIALFLILTSGGLGVLYVLHFKKIEAEREVYVSVFNTYAERPKVDISAYEIDITPRGERLEAESRLRVRNKQKNEIESVILYLNPGLKIITIEQAGKILDFHREQQVIEIFQKLRAGEEAEYVLKYEGGIEENICYTDVEEKDFMSHPAGKTFYFRYGKRYAFLSDTYTLLTPECIWYPVAKSPVSPANPYSIRKDFANYKLTVRYTGDKVVVSQGKRVCGEGKVIFTDTIPFCGVSLTIGAYETKAVSVDSTDYELYYFRGHDDFMVHFDALQDTLPAIIREIRADLEVVKNRSYPFRKFCMVEVPLSFTGYIRNWKGYSEHVMPELVFIPERGLRTQADFRAMGFRLKNWREEGELLDAKDVQAGMIKNYVKTTFVNENSSDENGWGRSTEVNKLNIGAMFYGFCGYLSDPDFPVIDIAFSTLQNITENIQRRWYFGPLITDQQRAIIYLQDHNFQTALSDKNLKPQVLYEILKLKSNNLKYFITAQVAAGEFEAFLKSFNETHIFEEVTFTEFARQFNKRFGIDLLPFIHQWYTTDRPAELMLNNVEVNSVVVDDFTKYQVRFKVYNRSKVKGILTVKIEEGGGGQRGFRPERREAERNNNLHNYIIPPQSAWEIKIINDERPGRVSINTNVSANLPSEYMYNFSKVDREVTDTLSGLFPVDTLLFTGGPGEIIVDNEDPGFNVLETNTRHKLKDLFRKEEEDKYQNFFPWKFPSRWTAVINSNCYGKPVHSAVYKAKGVGANKVQWVTTIPKDNYYEVFIWNPKFENWNWRRRNRGHEGHTQTYVVGYEEEEENITVDLGQEENGWVSLGNFYFPAGKVSVTLSDNVSAGFVMADAVKFTLINKK